MKLITTVVGSMGISSSHGIELKKGTGKTVHFRIGAPNKAGNWTQIRVGENLVKELEYDAPCSRDGDGTLGVCPECKITINEEARQKHMKKYPGSDIDVVEYSAAHTFTTKYHPARIGTILPVKVANTERLLLVEERQSDRVGRIGVLLSVEPRKGRRTAIIAPFQKHPFQKAVGQRWVGQTPHDGVWVERLLVLKANDRIQVVYFRNDPSEKTADKADLIVTHTLSIRTATSEEITPKPAKPQAEIETKKISVEADPDMTPAGYC